MKPIPTFSEAIEVAIEDIKKAMIENFEADQAETIAKDRKQKAHYNLQKANERLRNLQSDMYQVKVI